MQGIVVVITILPHPVMIEISRLLALMYSLIALIWLPSHVGLCGNELVDKLAEDAISEDDNNSYINSAFS
jgi:ribonuclease HI